MIWWLKECNSEDSLCDTKQGSERLRVLRKRKCACGRLLRVKEQTVLQAFVASPGDAAAERCALTEVVDELNQTWADFVGTRVELIKWESHAIPAAGPDPQAAINTQLLDDDEYDIFIGILRRRLGSSTPRAASGTVEEFERAHVRYSATGAPEIMFYLHSEAEQNSQISAFKQRLKRLGVFFWGYASARQFEQVCRIHLSRQIQRVARNDFGRPKPERIFPNVEQLDLQAALLSVRSLLEAGTISLLQYVERCSELSELTRQVTRDVEVTQDKLSLLGRPGFRQPKGGRAGIIVTFAKQLDRYAESTERLAHALIPPYSEGLDAYSRALAMIAPLAPLPQLFRPMVESTSQTIDDVGRALSGLRTSATQARDNFAEWERLDIQQLNDAKRSTLCALDSLDRELTDGIHLTREVERLAEEFLKVEL